ncbi:hypothetical protein NCCP2716_15190 [Sporosarcina sp. NCCP-2716]|uniref:PepSY domain-containing protein n=1 Tax=Sporosarcina sp. NCCP-2716 TaxID=2943679 RepID=UPI00203DB5AA|nr:PepSY domain-containing protein [Sporosarcina sp. NCCP-2716]GKV69021.1 hypothetical protein NCCP2716_15190 [Sporosarcina sp. NCCP-2716]
MKTTKKWLFPAILMIIAVLAGVFYMENNISQAETIPSNAIRSQLEVMYNGKVDQLRLDDDNYEAQLTRAGSSYALVIEGDTGKVLSMELVSAAPDMAAVAAETKAAHDDEDKKDRADKEGSGAGGDQSAAPAKDPETPVATQAPAAQPKPDARPAAGTAPAAQHSQPAQHAQPAKQQPVKKVPAAPAVQPKPNPSPPAKQPAQPQTPPKTVLLTKQQAIQIALRQLNGEVDDVDFVKTTDGGYYLVEIEIDVDDGPDEATYQIHAISGKVMSVTWDD